MRLYLILSIRLEIIWAGIEPNLILLRTVLGFLRNRIIVVAERPQQYGLN